jgi:3,4-dihydroxy 2-butanone 4-phosphate synthase/GTP cyclohydrolase II
MPVTSQTSNFKAILNDLKRGRPIIVVDDEERENEGDLVVAAEKVTPQIINFLTQQARGLVCVALPEERLDELQLPPMVQHNTDPYGTNFAVSVNARENVHTGISAADRAQTIKVLANPTTTAYDLVKPGHVFPLRAKPGGVLQRAGHTEAAVDLARLAGLTPAGITCEIMNPDGTMARLPQLQRFAKKHHFKIVTIAELIAYRKQREHTVQPMASATIPTKHGQWTMTVFESSLDHVQHIALVKGNVAGKKNVLVRVHSECLTGDVFGSQRCDCGQQLDKAMAEIDQAGEGVLLYLRQEGRGIGLVNKLNAYVLQDTGLDTVEANTKLGFPADLREYGLGAQMLSLLGLTSIKLLTNNPKKLVGLKGYGLKIVKQMPIHIEPNQHNLQYLKTKKKKLGHLLDV